MTFYNNALGKTTRLESTFLTLSHPESAMALSSSSLRMSSTFSTPSCPFQASPHKTGLPTKTISAPSARALRTSVPVETPPSRYS